jgi:hypothetical protein
MTQEYRQCRKLTNRSFYALLFFSAIFVMLIASQLFSFRKVDDTTNPVWVVFCAFWLIPNWREGVLLFR